MKNPEMQEFEMQQENGADILRKDIADVSQQITAEKERTGQTWLECFATALQVLSMDVSYIEQSGGLPQNELDALKNKFDKLLIHYAKLRKGSKTEFSDQEKSELIKMVQDL